MWYVIQVHGGQEEKTAEMMRKQVSPEVMEECFIPQKERVKKFRGRWQRVEEILFPGYVFAGTENPEELYRQLKRITKMTKILQDGAFTFLPLSEDEEEMVKTIGDNRHMTRLSRIRIAEEDAKQQLGGGKDKRHVVILDGPLKSQEGNIVKVDLHKREVTVRVRFMGRDVDLKLGIEMVEEKR